MRRWVIAAAGVAVLGAGVWIGRSSPSEAKVPAQPEAVPVERAPLRRAQAPVMPALPRRAAKPALTGLAADLVSTDAKVRLAAVREVARGDADPQQLLVASRDPDPSISAAALAALGKLYADGQVPVADMIARAKDRSGGPRVHTMALNALGGVAHPDAAKLLGEIAMSTSVGERRAATALLGSQAPEDAIPLLIAALGDQDDYVRDNAVTGLRALSRGRDFGTDAGAWRAWWQSAH